MSLRRRAAVLVAAGIVAVTSLFLLVADGAQAQDEGGRLSLKRQLDVAGIQVVATVTDLQGRSLPNTEVTFFRRTAFGWLQEARLTTGADGTARLILGPRGGRLDVRAVATLGDQEVSKTVRLELGEAGSPRERPGEATLATLSPQPGFISPYPPVRLLLTLGPILAGVWLTYAVVVYQLYRVARGG